MRYKQNGVALILVLMIVALMSIVALSTIHKNRILIEEAQLLKSSQLARKKLEDTRINLIKVLTTTPLWSRSVTNRVIEKHNLPKGVNFFGQPFSFEGVEVSMQSYMGLISLEPFNSVGLRRLLLELGYSDSIASTVVDSVADWIDTDDFVRLNGAEKASYLKEGMPRNGTIQTLDELRLVNGINEEMWLNIRPHITLFGLTDINLALANNTLLPALISEHQAEKVQESRKRYAETGSTSDLSGATSLVSSSPGKKIHVKLTYELDNTLYSESFTVAKITGTGDPIQVLDVVFGNYD